MFNKTLKYDAFIVQHRVYLAQNAYFLLKTTSNFNMMPNIRNFAPFGVSIMHRILLNSEGCELF